MQNVWYCVLENTSAFSDSFSLGGGGGRETVLFKGLDVIEYSRY